MDSKRWRSHKFCIFAAESCRSGRSGQTRNLLDLSRSRGFESLTFRKQPKIFNNKPFEDASGLLNRGSASNNRNA